MKRKNKKEQPRVRRSAFSGESRVSVNSYYSSRSSGSSTTSPFERANPKRLVRHLLVKGVDALFLLAIAAAVVFSLLAGGHSKVVASDTTFHQQNDYAQFINSRLSQFKNKNKITFDEIGLKQAILKAFPEVVSADVELPVFGRQPVVRLDVAKPALFIRSQGDEYLLSSNGVAVDLKSYYPKLTNLPTVDDESGFLVSKGRHVLSQQDMVFLETLAAEAKHGQVPIKKIVLPKSPEEADLYTSDTNYMTKFFMGGDATQQIGQFLASRNHFKSHPQPEQYLDVRVAGKIFYK